MQPSKTRRFDLTDDEILILEDALDYKIRTTTTWSSVNLAKTKDLLAKVVSKTSKHLKSLKDREVNLREDIRQQSHRLANIQQEIALLEHTEKQEQE